jgi:hypothetical protein
VDLDDDDDEEEDHPHPPVPSQQNDRSISSKSFFSIEYRNFFFSGKFSLANDATTTTTIE